MAAVCNFDSPALAGVPRYNPLSFAKGVSQSFTLRMGSSCLLFLVKRF